MLSTWHHNDYRENLYIDSLWSDFTILTREHFYHVGAKEANRNPMIEALAINFDSPVQHQEHAMASEQLLLLENQSVYQS